MQEARGRKGSKKWRKATREASRDERANAEEYGAKSSSYLWGIKIRC